MGFWDVKWDADWEHLSQRERERAMRLQINRLTANWRSEQRHRSTLFQISVNTVLAILVAVITAYLTKHI